MTGRITLAKRARQLGFGWLYLNPFHYPGFSGSLYAIEDYYRLYPLLEMAEWGRAPTPLPPAIRAIRHLGLSAMVDLVIDHTAKDSPLVAAHPGWFRRGPHGDVVKEAFGELGSAGGHRAMAKAVIPMSTVETAVGSSGDQARRRWVVKRFMEALSR